MKKIFFCVILIIAFSSNIVTAQDIKIFSQNYVETAKHLPRYTIVHTTDDPDYYQYVNGRYAYSVLVPKEFLLAALPANGDGCTFYTPDTSVYLKVCGSHLFGMSLYTCLENRKKTVGVSKVNYSNIEDNYYIISWIDEGRIHYEKHFHIDGYENNIEVIYPAAQKEKYADLVSKLINSFIPGPLTGYKILG